jgi:hypothetical protein
MALIPRPKTTGRPRKPEPVGYAAHLPPAFTARGEMQASHLIGQLVGRYLRDRLYVGKVVGTRSAPPSRLRMSYTAYRVVHQPQYDDEVGTEGDGYDSEELDGKQLTTAVKMYAQYQKKKL